jgi:outer membrane protein
MRVPRPSTPLLRTACALAALLLATGAARAQSLAELYEAARGYDATYLAARAQLESAEHRAEQSRALRRPNVALDVSAGRQASRADAADASATNTAVTAQLNARQTLFNRANDATIAQSDKVFEGARLDFELAEQDLIVRVAQAYFDVLASQDTLATARANKAAIAEQLASAKRNFEVGTATITDTREAQARFDLATAQEIFAENELRTRRIALDLLVGRSSVAPKGLAAPVALPATTPDSVDAWVDQASAQQPNLRKAQLAYDVAQLETRKARAGHLPTVGVSAALGYTDNSPGGGARFSTNDGGSKSGSIGIAMNLPIFSGWSVQNRIKETLSLEEKSRNDLDAARRQVSQATRTAFFGVQSGQAQVKALEAAESSSQLALEATQLGYRVGVRVNLDVLNAQTQLFSTRRDLARARYDVLVNSLRLRQAAGVLRADDVAAINALIAK